MQQNIVSGPNAKSKCREKTLYNLICKNKIWQFFCFTGTHKLRMFYQKNFVLWIKGIADLATSNNLNEGSHERKYPKRDRSRVKLTPPPFQVKARNFRHNLILRVFDSTF